MHPGARAKGGLRQEGQQMDRKGEAANGNEAQQAVRDVPVLPLLRCPYQSDHRHVL
jgi:hypothetical protein